MASERFLTKSQIISVIPGYEGLPESQDRMFERDKDDLRKLGIEIEVRNIDPLFEDEIGYRIRRSDYFSQLQAFSLEEGLVASVALSLIGEIEDRSVTGRAWMKLNALIDQVDDEAGPFSRFLSVERAAGLLAEGHLPHLMRAIHDRSIIEFDYTRDGDGLTAGRSVEPIRLSLGQEGWSLLGWDRSRHASRTFLVENISSLRVTNQNFPHREIPVNEANGSKSPIRLLVAAPTSKQLILEMEGGKVLGDRDGYVQIEFITFNLEPTVRVLISLGVEIEVVSPREARDLHQVIKGRMIDVLR
jgi:predicted DNA-binding transcriptional regulator YafY